MERYKVEITERALRDMEEFYFYIARELGATETALRLFDRLTEAALSLEYLPARIALVPLEPERSAGPRRLNVERYAIFYLIDGSTVKVTNVLYGRSDVETRLHEGLS